MSFIKVNTFKDGDDDLSFIGYINIDHISFYYHYKRTRKGGSEITPMVKVHLSSGKIFGILQSEFNILIRDQKLNELLK